MKLNLCITFMLVAVLLLWAFLHSGNRSMRAEVERRAAQSAATVHQTSWDDDTAATRRETAMAIVLEEPLPEVEQAADAPELAEDPIIVPATVEALAEEVAALFQPMLSEEFDHPDDNVAAQAEIIRKVPAIIGAMKVHAEELATPEGAGQLIGGVLGHLASEDASRRERIRQKVVEARVVAAESGLLIKEPEDEEEAKLWKKARQRFDKNLVEQLMPLVDTDRVSAMEKALSDQAVLIDLQERVEGLFPSR